MSETTPEITEEIWSEILKRLPVKVLGRCRCVSHSWNHFIVSPAFMTSHLKHYTQNAANHLLMYRRFSDAPKKEQYTLFLESAEGKEDENLEVKRTFTSPFVSNQSSFFRVVGSVHGLICLADDLCGYSYVVVLWNPLIHKYIKLPVPQATYKITEGAYISILGFGYHSNKGDHRVVRLVYVRDKDGTDTTPPKVELYSVQKGRWRWVDASYLVDICVCDLSPSQCFLNGSIHWTAWERHADTRVFLRNWLLLFDVDHEKFKKMKVPEALSMVSPLDLSISNFGDELSVLYRELKGGLVGKVMKHCEIWVKKEYNVGSSWCKMVNLELGSNLRLGWVQCLRKNGEILGFTGEGNMVSYDPIARKAKSLGLCGRWRSWFTGTYAESLILLNKKNGVGTYNEGGRKKRFVYQIASNFAQSLKEEEVESDGNDKDDQYHSVIQKRNFLILEQLMKFDGFRMSMDPSEFLSLAGLGM